MLQSRIRRGELDREIFFIEKVIAGNAFNEDKETSWDYIADYQVMARVMEKPGKEIMVGDRLTYLQSTTFTVDYRSDINVRMRIVYREKVYEIISITDNEGGRDRYQDVVAALLDSESVPVIT